MAPLNGLINNGCRLSGSQGLADYALQRPAYGGRGVIPSEVPGTRFMPVNLSSHLGLPNGTFERLKKQRLQAERRRRLGTRRSSHGGHSLSAPEVHGTRFKPSGSLSFKPF